MDENETLAHGADPHVRVESLNVKPEVPIADRQRAARRKRRAERAENQSEFRSVDNRLHVDFERGERVNIARDDVKS
jgi:hypothetical protein